jgi:hypothetical protein
MSLTREQDIALSLAGAVALPSPFPATASIRATADGSFVATLAKTYNTDLKLSNELLESLRRVVVLKVSNVISARLRMIRLLPLGSVRAVFVPDDCQAVCFERGAWSLSHQVALAATRALLDRAAKVGVEPTVEADVFPRPGIVYLPESSPLLMQVEVSMTAAESVEYYPPLPSDRSRDFRDLCNEDPILPYQSLKKAPR